MQIQISANEYSLADIWIIVVDCNKDSNNIFHFTLKKRACFIVENRAKKANFVEK